METWSDVKYRSMTYKYDILVVLGVAGNSQYQFVVSHYYPKTELNKIALWGLFEDVSINHNVEFSCVASGISLLELRTKVPDWMRQISWNAFSMRFNFLKGDFSPLLQTLLHMYVYPVPLSIRDRTFLLMLRSSRTMPFFPSWLSKPCRVLSSTKAWHHWINSSRFPKLRKKPTTVFNYLHAPYCPFTSQGCVCSYASIKLTSNMSCQYRTVKI